MWFFFVLKYGKLWWIINKWRVWLEFLYEYGLFFVKIFIFVIVIVVIVVIIMGVVVKFKVKKGEIIIDDLSE